MLLSGLTTLGKTVLLTVAITFIVWAIVTAIFVPKRNPGFPKRLDAYILASVIFFLAQMTTVVWVSETQEVEEAHAAEGTGGHGEEGEGEGAGRDSAARRGRQHGRRQGGVRERRLRYVSHACGRGATGTVGPNLDEAKPSAELVVERVTNGMGAMPSFADQLSEEQITEVAAYVSAAAGAS